MAESREATLEFSRRLEKDELEKEHLPNQGERLTKEYVERELQRYQNFLESKTFAEICKM